MKKQKPIYVQTEIQTTMDELWEHTQNPDLHTEWDVRFTEISYLPKEENEPQHFLYKTKIGFGLEIAGKGESLGEMQSSTGKRVSSLKFWTNHPLSLIREGRGYWKYEEKGKRIDFETLYDYDASFGKLGKVIDRYLFRPLLGWATAWSFDALKMWLEHGLHPKLLLKKTLTYWMVCFLLAFVWIYQGLVPKVIMTHPEEIKMLLAVIPISVDGPLTIRWIGVLEMIIGFIWLLPFQKKKLFFLHIIVIVGLTVSALIANPDTFVQPFNVVTLNVMLIVLSIIGYLNSGNLPSAKNCRRIRKG